MEVRKVMQRCLFPCKLSGIDIKESLILSEVCSHAPGNLGIGGVTWHLWVDSSPSCSPVQARLERDGKIQRRGEQAGRWEANHSLGSAHFYISCQELRSCKDLANACSSRNQDKQRCTQLKRTWWKRPLWTPWRVWCDTAVFQQQPQESRRVTSERSFILLILDHAEQISDFSLPQFLVSV